MKSVVFKRILLHLLILVLLILPFLKYSEEITDAKAAFRLYLLEIRKSSDAPKTMEEVKSFTAPIVEDAWFLDAPLIHHAGGGLDGNTYINSPEAIAASLEEGKYFLEIDLRHTSDGHLVCAHDWTDVCYKWDDAYLGDNDPTLEDFLAVQVQGEYSPLTAEELIAIMADNPQMYLVTDIKSGELHTVIAELVQLADRDPAILDRFVIQLYTGREKAEILKVYPFQDTQFLFTLYNWGTFKPEVVQICYEENISVITAPFGDISDTDISILRDLGYTVYEHTVNRIDQIRGSQDRGVSGFYTDFLSDSDLKK